MTNADDHHFDDYRRQTRIKHLILEAYLKPYYDIVSKQTTSLVYLDGFAGRGLYVDPTAPAGVAEGSPLRAMKVLASVPEWKQVRTVLIEYHADHFPALREAVSKISDQGIKLPEPELYNEKFSTVGRRVIQSLAQTGRDVPAVFAFIDPCGVEDVVFDLVVDILRRPFAECFVFFNYEGVSRIVGAALPSQRSPTLRNLMGSDAAAVRLLDRVSKVQESEAKERAIVDGYCDEFSKVVSPLFVAPFRVEHSGRRATRFCLTDHLFGARQVARRAGSGHAVDRQGGRRWRRVNEPGEACRASRGGATS